MADSSDQASLAQLCERIFALDHDLSRLEAGSAAHSDAWKRLHQLKERYKQLTGIYPRLPDSEPRGEADGVAG